MDKLYIAKQISPWMIDEITELSKYTDFEILLFRKPLSLYANKINQLSDNKIIISIFTGYLIINIFLFPHHLSPMHSNRKLSCKNLS